MWTTKKVHYIHFYLRHLKKISISLTFLSPPILNPINFFFGKVLTDQFCAPAFHPPFKYKTQKLSLLWAPCSLCDHRVEVGGGERGVGWGGRLLAHKSPDRIWLQKCRAGEQGGRNESEIPQTEEGYFSFKRLRIVGFQAYSDGTRKDFNFFASFSLALNKTKVEHIQNIHYNFLLPFKVVRQHPVKDLGLHSTQ